MLERARTLPADEVVIDLEDAVAPAAKDDARAKAVAALALDWGGRSVAVRINAVGTEWWERDVAELAAAGGALGTLVVPKCESASELEAVEELLEGPGPGLQALVETAPGLVAIREIAGSSPRLRALIVGYADLAASLGRPPGGDYPGDRWHHVRETVLIHARAAGLDAIDGPFLDFKDAAGLEQSARGARALGYDGKWAIHPTQVEPLNEIFSPTAEEFERAAAVLEALEHAGAAEGRGAVQLEGEMVDEAIRKQAARTIARGEAAGLRR